MSHPTPTSRRIAIVVQRYGDSVIGGAEWQARQYAELLAKIPGLQVTVLTTTAKDYVTWRNHFAVGAERSHGVDILRFRTTRERHQASFSVINHLAGKIFRRTAKIAALGKFWRWCEQLWYYLQGPVAPDLLGHIKHYTNDYDAFIFFTYLYAPTAYGLPLVGKKSILVPEFHEEAPAYFATTRFLFENAAAVLCNTAAEMALIHHVVPGNEPKTTQAGVGLDAKHRSHEWPAKISPQRRYLLYLGRVSAGKNIQQLIAWFQDFTSRHNAADLQLVLAGEKEDNVTLPAGAENILYLGFVDEQQKHNLISQAQCVVNPSRFESLSLIVLEALQVGTPVVVNGECAVLKDYTHQVQTAFAYHSQDEFDRCLSKVIDPTWRQAAGTQAQLASAQAWIEQNYSWQAITDKVLRTIDRFPAAERR